MKLWRNIFDLFGVGQAEVTSYIVVILYKEPYLRDIAIQARLSEEFGRDIKPFFLVNLLKKLRRAGVLQSKRLGAASDRGVDFWAVSADLLAEVRAARNS